MNSFANKRSINCVSGSTVIANQLYNNNNNNNDNKDQDSMFPRIEKVLLKLDPMMVHFSSFVAHVYQVQKTFFVVSRF
jgi:hypothetical protein